MGQKQSFDNFLEEKKKESGERFPVISDSEINEFIDADPFFKEMTRRMEVVNKLINP